MSNDAEVSAGGLRPVELAPAHTVVVRYLRRAIHLFEFPPGAKLPAERDMALQLGVSRATLREALRNLEGAGYVEVRRGATGGFFVLDRTVSIEEARRWYVDQDIDVETLFEFRAVVESFAARQAAVHADPELVAELRSLNERMKQTNDVGEFRQADQRFHMRVAEAAGADYVRSAVEETRAALFLPYKLINLAEMQVRSGPEHESIVAALETHNPDAAAGLMQSHIRGTIVAAGLRPDT